MSEQINNISEYIAENFGVVWLLLKTHELDIDRVETLVGLDQKFLEQVVHRQRPSPGQRHWPPDQFRPEQQTSSVALRRLISVSLQGLRAIRVDVPLTLFVNGRSTLQEAETSAVGVAAATSARGHHHRVALGRHGGAEPARLGEKPGVERLDRMGIDRMVG